MPARTNGVSVLLRGMRAMGFNRQERRNYIINQRRARTRENYPTQVNPNKNEHWSGLTTRERRWGSFGNGSMDYQRNSYSPMPVYVASRRSVDGREQVARTHAQRYKDLRAAFNVT